MVVEHREVCGDKIPHFFVVFVSYVAKPSSSNFVFLVRFVVPVVSNRRGQGCPRYYGKTIRRVVRTTRLE